MFKQTISITNVTYLIAWFLRSTWTRRRDFSYWRMSSQIARTHTRLIELRDASNTWWNGILICVSSNPNSFSNLPSQNDIHHRVTFPTSLYLKRTTQNKTTTAGTEKARPLRFLKKNKKNNLPENIYNRAQLHAMIPLSRIHRLPSLYLSTNSILVHQISTSCYFPISCSFLFLVWRTVIFLYDPSYGERLVVWLVGSFFPIENVYCECDTWWLVNKWLKRASI